MADQLLAPNPASSTRAATAQRGVLARLLGPMPRYILRRLGQSVLTVFLTLTTVFVLIRMAPGDPAYSLAGPLASTEDLARIRTDMGLDQSVFVQYLKYLQGLLHLDLGTSYSFQAPAFDVVLSRLPYTITLAVSAILLTTLVAIPLGVWMARRADTRRELAANAVTIAGQSMPDFWTGLMLITVFAVLIPVLPPAGFTTWSSLILPTVTIAVLQVALISRMVRREMVGAFLSPYITVGRARGVSERELIWRYSLRNSAIPVLTFLAVDLGFLLGGTVVVEGVFNLPGVGQLLFQAIRAHEGPTVVGVSTALIIIFLLTNLVVDLLSSVLDPRIRHE